MREFIVLLLVLLLISPVFADTFTDHLSLVKPTVYTTEGGDWATKLNTVIESMDDTLALEHSRLGSHTHVTADSVRVQGILSVDDHIIVSAESTSTVGGAVGRIAILSTDGETVCYISIYAGS